MLNKTIERRWQQSSSRYSELVQEELHLEVNERWKSYIIEKLPKREHLNILDIGCGPGFFSLVLGDMGHRVVGIDISENMIREAKANTASVGVKDEFYVMDSHELEFEDSSFDVIISRNVVWTLYDPERAYDEWVRCLRGNGRMIIFDANWNLPLHDKKLRRHKKEDEQKFRKLYGKPCETCEDEKLSRNMDREVPLSKIQRPQWDKEKLEKMGLQVSCDLDAYVMLWNEQRKLRYRTTPMFMIYAKK